MTLIRRALVALGMAGIVAAVLRPAAPGARRRSAAAGGSCRPTTCA